MPWSTQLRTRCISGSPTSSTIVLSRSVSAPAISRWISLPRAFARSRTIAREAVEDLADRHHADLHDALLDLVGRAGEQRRGLREVLGERGRRRRPAPRPFVPSSRPSVAAISEMRVRLITSSPTRFSRLSSRSMSTRIVWFFAETARLRRVRCAGGAAAASGGAARRRARLRRSGAATRRERRAGCGHAARDAPRRLASAGCRFARRFASASKRATSASNALTCASSTGRDLRRHRRRSRGPSIACAV